MIPFGCKIYNVVAVEESIDLSYDVWVHTLHTFFVKRNSTPTIATPTFHLGFNPDIAIPIFYLGPLVEWYVRSRFNSSSGIQYETRKDIGIHDGRPTCVGSDHTHMLFHLGIIDHLKNN